MNKRQRLRYTTKLISRISYHVAKGDKETAQKTMFRGFLELGGVYVKFLQVLSLKSEFFTTFDTQEKLAVYDAVAPETMNINEVLQTQLPPESLAKLIQVDPHPFAAGSFGQVYYAMHQDGTALIIKALRTNLVEHIKTDLRVLRVISNIMSTSYKGASDIGSLFNDFRSVILSEIDYKSEIEHGMYFYDYFFKHPNIVIPKIYPDLSTDSIIVEEYIGGLPMTKLMQLVDEGGNAHEIVKKELDSDLTVQVGVLGKEILRSILIADKITGDPHPGNIKLLPNDQLGLYDFGITGTPPTDRKAFLDLVRDYIDIHKGKFDPGRSFVNGLRFFASDLFRALNTLARVNRAGEELDIIEEIKKIATKVYAQIEHKIDFNQFVKTGNITKVFTQAINEDNRFKLRTSTDASVMIRAADGYMSMVEKLGLREELIPEVFEIAIEELEEEGFLLKGKKETMDFDSAVNIVSDWIQDLMESDPAMFRSLASQVRRSAAS